MKNRIWNGALILLALLFAGLLAGFAMTVQHTRDLTSQLKPENGAEAAATAGERTRIALISQEQDNPFWQSVEAGAAAAAERYGMELEYMGPTRINPSEQTRLLEKAIAEGFDGLLVQGQNDLAYASLIDQASASGIPVLTIDADEPDSARAAYVGTDNLEAGRRMGELVVRSVGDKGELGVLLGSEASNQQLRLEGFRSVIARHPDLVIADVRTSNISRLQAEEQTEDMLREHPDLKAVIGFSALDALGIAEAADHRQADGLLVFGFDDPGNTRQEIGRGRIAAVIVQQPGQIGEKAVTLLHDYMQGKKIEELHYTGTAVLDRAALAASEDGVSSQACVPLESCP
ncbi:substrate-binding domain-containing protein [Cohnella lubricantis]|uniref:Substrate-binding domain-containing protein n=1 Tax=Cohnella lubricantis TaxID=2163172 RepID=A0A841T4Y5_9BACL|nr:substrate-binding domain-containing protein [Cohnella lubricantis]MBB6675912.1 substrate-binding domain-containing protein [Cohnella lubricantis]MBP2117171.1 ribose transport system substrate-binding protein [Cohnella lubricantis]